MQTRQGRRANCSHEMRIQDVAKEAGVSSATVSRVFSNNSAISPEVRERVLSIARKFAYHPRLSTKKRNVIVITPSRMEHPIQNYTEMMVSELARALNSHGFRMELLPQEHAQTLDSLQFCGAVDLAYANPFTKDWDSKFDSPLVGINNATPQANNAFLVNSDEFQGMRLAVDFLVERGFSKIGCIVYGRADNVIMQMRRDGVFKALQAHGLEVDDSLARLASQENFVEETGMLLRKGVEALITTGEDSGIMASYALSLYGKRIPNDISLISFERAMTSRYCTPPQTTLSQDLPALALAAMEAIAAKLDRRAFPKKTLVPYKLTVRDSVGKKR